MTSRLQLVVSQGPQPGRAFAIDRDELTIGRDPTNGIVINEPQVSRRHARVTQRGGLVVIEDLGSTNGTYVNGMRLLAPRALTPGDVVGLGEAVTLTFYSSIGDGSTADMGVMSPPEPAPAYEPPIPADEPYAFPSYAQGAAQAEFGAEGPQYPEEPEEDGREGKRRQYWMIGCGCLALVLACVAIALFLWFAPTAFWDFLIELGIPVPTNPF